jgi:hypothetical protein
MAEQTVMPAAFLGHGSPMDALEHNRSAQAWRAFGTSVPLTPYTLGARCPPGAEGPSTSGPLPASAPVDGSNV